MRIHLTQIFFILLFQRSQCSRFIVSKCVSLKGTINTHLNRKIKQQSNKASFARCYQLRLKSNCEILFIFTCHSMTMLKVLLSILQVEPVQARIRFCWKDCMTSMLRCVSIDSNTTVFKFCSIFTN